MRQYCGHIRARMFQANTIPVRQMQLKLPLACLIPIENRSLLQTHIIGAPSCAYCHPIGNGPLTVEGEASTCRIFAPPIFCHAFISAGVFLLEIGYFKDGV